MSVRIICDFCGDEFEVRNSRSDTARFCSRSCMGSWKSENNTGESHPNWSRKSISCDGCGKEFEKRKKRIERSEKHFCSDSCRLENWSDEVRVYAPEGEDHPNWSGGKISRNCSFCSEIVHVDPNRSDSDNVFCDRTCYGDWLSENYTGEGHPRWKESSSQRTYLGSWNKVSSEVRNEYPRCQECGMKNSDHVDQYGFGLHVHHIKRYESFDDPDEANKKENLVPLCSECHVKVETTELSISSPYENT